MGENLIDISQQLLLNTKLSQPTENLVASLAEISEVELSNQLITDNDKKAFWINIYNAFIQIILAKTPANYSDRRVFFTSKQLVIAQHNFSLDDIEHGILRRSKIKHGLGYITNPFASTFEKMHRVNKVDSRIHFCLNCGAVSCPPIAFFKPENLDRQMDLATKSYLQNECFYDETTNTIGVPSLLLWFKADFGTSEQIIELLVRNNIIPIDKRPSLQYKTYNWQLDLHNYKNDIEH